MKNVTSQAFQGDVMFRKRVEPIPVDARLQPSPADGIVVAHSETGHHHVAEGRDLSTFSTTDPRFSFLRVPEFANIIHRRDFDTHEPLRLDAGDWDVVRQREHRPEGWQTVAD